MIDTGKTLTLATRMLHEKGAKGVYALISHGNYFSSARGRELNVCCRTALGNEYDVDPAATTRTACGMSSSSGFDCD
jgi:phosphoribosylpyrophosphate synthetase